MIPSLTPANHPWAPVIQAVLTLKGANYTVRKPPTTGNPILTHPIYRDDDIHLDNPLIILDYLDEKYPSPSIYPTTPPHKHTMRYLIACFIDQPKQNTLSWLETQIAALPPKNRRPYNPPSPFDLFLICHADLSTPMLKPWSTLNDAIHIAQRHLLRQTAEPMAHPYL